MRILFVTYGFPYPPDIGPRIRDYNLIRQVAQSHSVLVLSLGSPPVEEDLAELRKQCEMCEVIPDRRLLFCEHLKGIATTLLSRRPLATHPFFYEEMASRLRDILENWHVDVVQIEHSFLAGYIDALPKGIGCRTVLSLHNVGVRQYHRMLRMRLGPADRLVHVAKWLAMIGWEPRIARRFDHTLVVSAVEKQLLLERDPGLRVTVIENGVDVRSDRFLTEAPKSHQLIFVGTLGYAPNTDAVLYFHREIFPRIQGEIPDVRFVVVGAAPPESVVRLAKTEAIEVTGHVPDVIPYYRASGVSVVPLRAGGGTRLKILESMALGRPVVSTSLGCEGLELTDGKHVLIADDPGQFARKTILLLKSPELRREIARQARALVENIYDWRAISRKLIRLYGELAESHTHANVAG